MFLFKWPLARKTKRVKSLIISPDDCFRIHEYVLANLMEKTQPVENPNEVTLACTYNRNQATANLTEINKKYTKVS